MYQVSVYSVTADLWRWEVRCDGTLLRCGTAPTRLTAARDANWIFIIRQATNEG
jgi:hypothetical protein